MKSYKIKKLKNETCQSYLSGSSVTNCIEIKFSNTSQRIIVYKVTLDKVHQILGNINIHTPKRIHLGRLRPDVNRPLNVIFSSKEGTEI